VWQEEALGSTPTRWPRGGIYWDGSTCLPGALCVKPFLVLQQLTLLSAPGDTAVVVSWLIEKG